jgi:dTDP-4-dehydrorhamnose 3,5-epimerase
MDWEPLPQIPSVLFALIKPFKDDRGNLAEFWRIGDLELDTPPLGEVYEPVMGYMSFTNPGRVRGPHEHREQSDLFVFAGPGAFELHLFDYIRHPKTGEIAPKNWFHLPVGDPDHGPPNCIPVAVMVPPGIVHGYKCISDVPGLVINLPDRLYRGPSGKDEVDEIRHEDDPNSPFKIE